MTVSTMIEDISLTVTVKLSAKVLTGQLVKCDILPPKQGLVTDFATKVEPYNLLKSLNRPEFASELKDICQAYHDSLPSEVFNYEFDTQITAIVEYYPEERTTWDCPGSNEEFSLIDLTVEANSLLDLVGLHNLAYYLDNSAKLTEHIINEVKEIASE